MCYILTQKINSDSGLISLKKYIIFLLKFIIDEPFYDGCFSSAGISQKNDFECPFANGRTRYGHFRLKIKSFYVKLEFYNSAVHIIAYNKKSPIIRI
jgi:hypothetical protein